MSEILVITGMSGAGRSTAADALEDQGWFWVDNMPPALLPDVARLVGKDASNDRVAFVVGTGAYIDELAPALDKLRRMRGRRVRILFLDASDETIVRRFEGTRRRHPQGAETLVEGIRLERDLLQPIKSQADVIVDTTDLNVHQLRERLVDLFARDVADDALQVTVLSFGFKHGTPIDADLVFDCRFLPNPHWVDELRPLTGRDEAVRDYVMAGEDTAEFLDRVGDLVGFVLPRMVKEGKAHLTIAIGCTGGRHRSVCLAEALAGRIEEHGFHASVQHRDVGR